jgi:hypothetical protein
MALTSLSFPRWAGGGDLGKWLRGFFSWRFWGALWVITGQEVLYVKCAWLEGGAGERASEGASEGRLTRKECGSLPALDLLGRPY